MEVSGQATIEVRQPKSLNAILYAPWQKQARIKRDIQREIEGELMAWRVPRRLSSVRATALLIFPLERRRDEGNYRSVLEKALGDALTNGGWLVDDTPDHFTFGELEFQVTAGEPAVARITLVY